MYVCVYGNMKMDGIYVCMCVWEYENGWIYMHDIVMYVCMGM